MNRATAASLTSTLSSAPASRHSRPVSLRRSIAYTFLSNVLYAGSQWFMLCLLARYGNISTVGQYVYCLAVAAPVFMCLGFQLRSLQATDVTRTFRFVDYLKLGLMGNAVAFAVIIGLSFVVSSTREVQALLIVVATGKLCEGISEIFYGKLQQAERLDLVAISRVLHGSGQLFAFALVLLACKDVIRASLAAAVTRGIVTGGFDICLLWRYGTSHSISRSFTMALRSIWRPASVYHLRPLLQIATPLAGTVLLASLMSNAPKYFLASFVGDASLGIFGVFTAILTAGATVTVATNQASCNRLAQLYFANELQRFRHLLLQTSAAYVSLAGVGALLIWWQGEAIVTFLFGAQIAPHKNVLALILASGTVNYTVGLVHNALLSVRKIHLLSQLATLSGGWTIICCFLLIPTYGLWGAALTMFLGKLPTLVIGLNVLLDPRRATDSTLPLTCAVDDESRGLNEIPHTGRQTEGSAARPLRRLPRSSTHSLGAH